MTIGNIMMILATVAGIAIGQILFKLTANAYKTAGTPFDPSVAVPLFSGLAVYGLATLAWLWALQFVELSRAYPFMALGFVLVPLGSMLLFGEKLDVTYFAGIGFICLGVVLAGR